MRKKFISSVPEEQIHDALLRPDAPLVLSRGPDLSALNLCVAGVFCLRFEGIDVCRGRVPAANGQDDCGDECFGHGLWWQVMDGGTPDSK